MRILTVLSLFVSVTSFHAGLIQKYSAFHGQENGASTRLAAETDISSGIGLVSTTPTPACAGGGAKKKIPHQMDEIGFHFNKMVVDSVYDIICRLYPVTGSQRDFARFYVLETVARVPYFAYLSVLHLRETYGERSNGLRERMRTHYAEADNELHHLLIMESLGGNSSIVDRTIAQTMAFGYYWFVIVAYSLSEPAAYHLSELIEDHAFKTYHKYLTEHEDMLRSRPVPPIATKYYIEDNPFLLDLFCTVKDRDEESYSQRPPPRLDSLYDVFVNVRNDEREHWKTLCNLVQYNEIQGDESRRVEGTKPVVSRGNQWFSSIVRKAMETYRVLGKVFDH